MTDNILIIPWHNRDHEIVTLLNLILADLGYSVIVLDKFLPEVTSNDLEKIYHLHKPDAIITRAEEDVRLGEALCKLVKENLLTKNIKLLYLESLTCIEVYPVHGMNYCKPDEYLILPFSPEELEEKLYLLLHL
ncbi:MAG: hypothetical protein KC449_17175 [Anaerolineales bacterium]|nr:hypothetical protein [Anaerolineales bacterium]